MATKLLPLLGQLNRRIYVSSGRWGRYILERKKRIGVLTGGGDCPGLNAAIRAVTKSAIRRGFDVIGIQNGWKGLLDNETIVLDRLNTSGIIDRGGTILGTSRVSPLVIENGPQQVFKNFRELALEALVVLGGEGTSVYQANYLKWGFR